MLVSIRVTSRSSPVLPFPGTFYAGFCLRPHASLSSESNQGYVPVCSADYGGLTQHSSFCTLIRGQRLAAKVSRSSSLNDRRPRGLDDRGQRDRRLMRSFKVSSDIELHQVQVQDAARLGA